jgi:hypothetical protein
MMCDCLYIEIATGLKWDIDEINPSKNLFDIFLLFDKSNLQYH